jgi:AmmeMemoRadiSam system protein A/AmmeMemoRadiSam system protein B
MWKTRSQFPTRLSPATLLPAAIQPPVVANFWPDDSPEELAATVDSLLATVEPLDGAPIALIVPSTASDLSAGVAACGFKQLAAGEYDLVVLIASDHRSPLTNAVSVWPGKSFTTPLGGIPVDIALAEALVAAAPRIVFAPETQTRDRLFQMPGLFIQRVCPRCPIVPIRLGAADEEAVNALTEALLSVLAERRAVIIVSADLSCYPHPEDVARVDKTVLAALETANPEAVWATLAAFKGAKMSGPATGLGDEGSILAAMQVAQGLGANTTTVLGYANSANYPQTASDYVVGYGAVMFWRYDPPDLTATHRETLLALARAAIAEYLQTGRLPAFQTNDPLLSRRAGVFVTLRKRALSSKPGQNGPPLSPEMSLRGCIGHLWADCPLYQVVQKMAVAAATSDPRFPPLTPEELSALGIEISVLSPLHRLTGIEQIEIGVHGLVIAGAGRQGLLLPQVAVTRGWSREEFLQSLCRKAGLPTDIWPGPAALYAFTTLTFEEEHLS